MTTPVDLSWMAGLPTTWLGYAAAVCTTAAFVPQALLTLRTRDVSGISLGMYGAFTFGIVLWLWYGWRLQQWPLILANAVTLALALTILGTKLVVMHQETRRRAP